MKPRMVLLALAVALFAFAAPASAHLPDLVADPPENPYLETDADENGEERLLLRFDGHVHNAGTGPLEITRTSGGTAGVVEQIFRDGVTHDPDPLSPSDLLAPDAMKYENTDGHNHWHLQRIARYSLDDASGTAPVAPVMKVGFCLLDSEDIADTSPRRYGGFCQRGQTNPTLVRMGVAPGWRDVYDGGLPFQYVDVSETQPGPYRLRSWIDPENLVEESDEAGNLVPGETNYTLRGYEAATGDGALTGGAVELDLRASTHGAPLGPKRFMVTSAPEHGTLSVPTGVWLSNPTVTYTSDDPSSPPADRFTFAADDSGSAYPRHPGRATVLLGPVGAERVALSRVPERLRAGMTVDLDADVRDGASQDVSWSVSGGGTIDDGGRYTAPTSLPPGNVTVTAMGPGGATDSMDIEITEPPPPPQPAPRPSADDAAQDVVITHTTQSPPGPIAQPPTAPRGLPTKPPARKRTPVGSVRIGKIGPQFAIGITPRASGRLRASLMRGKRRLATCIVRVRVRRSALCRLRVRPRATAIALTLVRSDGKIERRRVKVPGGRS